MALFRRGSRDVPAYSDKIYAMHLLKRYEIRDGEKEKPAGATIMTCRILEAEK